MCHYSNFPTFSECRKRCGYAHVLLFDSPPHWRNNIDWIVDHHQHPTAPGETTLDRELDTMIFWLCLNWREFNRLSLFLARLQHMFLLLQ